MFGLEYLEGPWRNDACMGYALLAMRREGIDEETIRNVMAQMYWCFDEMSVEAAADYYCNGRC